MTVVDYMQLYKLSEYFLRRHGFGCEFVEKRDDIFLPIGV